MINIYILLKYNASLHIGKVSKANNMYIHIIITNDNAKICADFESAFFEAFSVETINELLDEFEKEVAQGNEKSITCSLQ